jgi:NADH:ubiquinone reductase (H+-translocating)
VNVKGKRSAGVLGGGFAGLYSVSYLRKRLGDTIEITLFDKNNFLLYTPVLHEMATGTVNARHVVVPLRKVINAGEIHVRCEEVTAVDLETKVLETTSGQFSFDHLILAQGSESNFYSIPGLKENSLSFKTISDGSAIRNKIIEHLEKGAIEKNEERRKALLTINVVGGGCTGVELIAEIAQFINIILKKDYPEIARSEVRINMIEAAGKILTSFPAYLSQVAMERLRGLGVELLFKTRLDWVDENTIGINNDIRLPRGILIWTGGVRALDLITKQDIERDSINRIIVDDYLQIPGYPNVYVIGDAAHFIQNSNPLPPTASVAVQEARFVADNIAKQMRKKSLIPFHFHYRGDMASLGFMSGVCEVYGHQFQGFIAWVIWKAFKLAMLPRYKNRLQIVADWLITFIFKRDTSRLS